MPSSAVTVTAAKMKRQLVCETTMLPASGARIGETLKTSISSDIKRVASGPVCRSRTTARGITMPAQAPTPSMNLNTTRVSMFGARPQPMLPSANSPRPKYSGGLRPSMSETGP